MNSNSLSNMATMAMRTARLLWVVLFLFSVGLFIYALPARYSELKTVSSIPDTRVGELSYADAQVLSLMGLSPEFYAAYFTTLEALVAIPFIVVGLFIFLRKSDDWVALTISITGILIGTMGVPVVNSLSGTSVWLTFTILVLRVAGVSGLVVMFFLFPDGRFAPTWSRWLVLLWMIYTVFAILIPPLHPPPGIASLQESDIPLTLWYIVWTGMGIASQVYRYLFFSTPIQRQQTKWVVYGCVLLFLLILVATLPNLIFENLRQSNVESMQVRFFAVTIILVLAMPILPITIGISIFRFRLWDIDVLIRRTLVYSILTFLLILVYLTSVLVLQLLFTAVSGQGSPIAIVISTLVIAALFTPARKRVQKTIDKRFYRRKYNAERALNQFANTARDEVDIQRLASALLDVMQETMQPEKVSLWLGADAPLDRIVQRKDPGRSK